MAHIKIRLNAYVIPDDHDVWKCFPGKSYRFYELVQKTGIVFLDIRGLETLDKNPAKWDDDEVLEKIAEDRWAREVKKTAPGKQPKGSPGVSPTDRKHLTFLKGLLLDAKQGDLIVLPAEGYQKEALVGELTGKPGRVVKLEAKDGEETFTYIGRRVRWLGSQEKRFFSPELIELLHIQTVFFALPKSLHEEVYRIAYKSYVVGDIVAATFSTSKDHFSTSDSAVTGTWLNALAAVRRSIEEGELLDDRSYFELGLSPAEGSSENELLININSPGEYLIRSTGIFPLILMAMLPLSALSAEDIVDGDIQVEVNTVGSVDACPLDIPEGIREYAKTLGVDRLQESCRVGTRAQEEATLDTDAQLITAED